MSNYKTCAVPMCTSTTIKCPEKLFIHVPKSPKRRKQWLQLARRDPQCTSENSTIFFCEDHFDLPNDMENYIQYTIMGSVGKVRMKPDCLPSRFECQPDRKKRTAPPQPRSAVIKRQRTDIIQEILSQNKPATSGMTSNTDFLSNEADEHSNFQDQATQVYPEVCHKIIQVSLTAKIRSKSIQTSSQGRDKHTSPLKTNTKTTATSPCKLNYGKIRKKLLFAEASSSSNSSSPLKCSQLNVDSSPSVKSFITMTSTSSDQETQSELTALKMKVEAKDLCKKTMENNVRLIKNNPRYYVGITKSCYFLINIIHRNTKIPEEHILLCLKKIRLNTPFSELADQFGLSTSYACKIFMKSVTPIAHVLHPFIIKSNKTAVKKNLPMAFRHKYYNIYCIIDCLEIEIQKPSKSVEQALTWSEYKKANTAKYLISSTPDGIINYVSPGYSGRITDVLLVSNCNFLDCLEPGVSILADRGFKHIEELLLQKGIFLVRPPSVASNSKLSKQDVIKTKQIASLRIHIERIIRRLREFSMLKPHSVVNRKLLKYLDECVIIACALINLQDGIIKNK